MENIFMVILGVVCIVLGILNTKGNISTLHAYHRKRVSEEDRLPFGRLVGLGTIIIGCAMILMGGLFYMASLLENNLYSIMGTVILIVGFVVGMGITFYAIKKYNKGIF